MVSLCDFMFPIEQVVGSVSNSNLVSLYRNQLVSDLRKRVRSDPDFSAERFPVTTRVVQGTEESEASHTDMSVDNNTTSDK